MEACQTCKREFHSFQEYPFIYVEQVSIRRVDNVPSTIHRFSFDQNIFEGYPERPILKELPQELLTHFKENPQKNEMQHTDGFVYYRRPWPTDEELTETTRNGDYVSIVQRKLFSFNFFRKKRKDDIVRHRNYAPEIRNILEKSEDLRNYFKSLEDSVGKIIRPDEVLPLWENKGHIKWLYPIPQKDFQISLGESQNVNTIQIRLYGGVACMNEGAVPLYDSRPLFVLGDINYEGRISKS